MTPPRETSERTAALLHVFRIFAEIAPLDPASLAHREHAGEVTVGRRGRNRAPSGGSPDAPNAQRKARAVRAGE